MEPIRTVFFGTPPWAVPSLHALVERGHSPLAVVTNPDKPSGRKGVLRPPPVKETALALGLHVLQPQTARSPDLHDLLEEAAPDICVVVAYGKILPGSLLAIPRHGFLNLHFSLLPAYRGAAPVQRALMAGETRTGVSIIVLSEGMDEGPVLAERTVDVGPEETAEQLGARLSDIGAPLLVETMEAFTAGLLEAVPQDHSRATYAPKLTLDDARIDWSLPASRVVDLVRGTTPEPGPWTTLDGRRVKIYGARVTQKTGLGPGELDATDGLQVGTGSAAVRVMEVQKEGGRRITAEDFLRGLRTTGGLRFS